MPVACDSYSASTSRTSAIQVERLAGWISGERAYWLKASTMPLSCATWLTMVCVARLSISASGAASLSASRCVKALGRQLNRRERILDLVRQASRDFAPGGVALRLQQARDVVEHQHEAAFRAGLQRGSAQQQHFAARLAAELDLLLPGCLAALQRSPRAIAAPTSAQARIVRAPVVQAARQSVRLQLHAEDLLGTRIGRTQAPLASNDSTPADSLASMLSR